MVVRASTELQYRSVNRSVTVGFIIIYYYIILLLYYIMLSTFTFTNIPFREALIDFRSTIFQCNQNEISFQ